MEVRIDMIKKFIKTNINHKNINMFDSLIKDIENYVEGGNAHNMTELRDKANNKKKKGDLFEAFCFLYIKNILKHDEVWFYSDIPSSSSSSSSSSSNNQIFLKEKLSLNTTQDYGIDIVSRKGTKYYAIQCKYRKPKDQIQTVSWKELSTFYGIVNKTGPWEKHVTMTNVNGCRHIGEKTEKDWSICIGTFRGLNNFKWLQLIGEEGNEIEEGDEIEKNKNKNIKNKYITPNIEDLRQKRLQFFNNV